MILRLKEGMDASEPSTNGTSSSNLFRLSSVLNDESYAKKAKETVKSFESEMLQYPWLFPSFMPAIVASHLGVKSVVIHEAADDAIGKGRVQEFKKSPRGGLGTIARLSASEGNGQWLRERNPLLRAAGKSAKTKILICENGVCKEEDDVFFVDSGVKMESPNDAENLKMAGLKESLPNLEGSANKGLEEEKNSKGYLQQVDLATKSASVADAKKEN